MNKRLYMVIGGVIVFGAIIAVGAFGYIYASAGSGQASAPISAPAVAASNSTQKQFSIDSTKSEVQFSLTEVLMGQPANPVGKTNQVAGSILIDPNNPAASTVGEIRIDARTLATDSSMRDRMIRGQILQSSTDKFEYITFVPTKLSGLPDKVTPGQSLTFKITGNLTIRDVTHEETFDATVKWITDAPEHVEGTATATVHRADYNLQIPNVPTVANVSDDVKLTITFQALPATSQSASATAAATLAQ